MKRLWAVLTTHDDAPDLITAIRSELHRVRTPEVQHGLHRVLDLLASARAAGFHGSLMAADSPGQARERYRAILQQMTPAERDEATDQLVLAITFAMSGDEGRARERLAEVTRMPLPGSRQSVFKRLWRRGT